MKTDDEKTVTSPEVKFARTVDQCIENDHINLKSFAKAIVDQTR